MFNFWLLAFGGLAAADWLAVWHQRRQISFLTKPLTLVVLIIWLWTKSCLSSGLLFFCAGLIFSLLGDIFLLWNHQWFRVGLASFLCAHGAYIIAFNQTLPELSMTFYILGLTVISIGMMIFTYLYTAMRQSRSHKRMIVPVGIYSIVIALMLFSSLLTLFRPDWPLKAAAMTAAGGVLFFVSDTMLALDRFVRPFRRARFWIRVSYHLGQLLLAVGAFQYGLR